MMESWAFFMAAGHYTPRQDNDTECVRWMCLYVFGTYFRNTDVNNLLYIRYTTTTIEEYESLGWLFQEKA